MRSIAVTVESKMYRAKSMMFPFDGSTANL
jgi:hypothetical protein